MFHSKYNIYVRIHCGMKVLHGFIVIYRINVALLKYLEKSTRTPGSLSVDLMPSAIVADSERFS